MMQVLLRQTYDPKDWHAHLQYLLQFFTHPDYIKIDGKPVLLLYRCVRVCVCVRARARGTVQAQACTAVVVLYVL